METLFSNISFLQAFITLLAVAQLFSLLVNYKLWQKVAQQQSQIIKLEREQSALLTGSVGLGRKMLQMNHRVDDLAMAQNDILQPDFSEQAIEAATNMLRSGASIDEVTQTCRLSQGEVELLKQMLPRQSVH